MVMGETAELLAEQYKISREEQDSFALESHRRAARAVEECRFGAETVAIERKDKKGNITRIEKDEHVRADLTPEALAKLPPVFSKTGSVTAGNSSGITDGAAALVLASEEKVRELGLKPLARIVDATVCAVDPRVMGVGPVPAVRKLAARTGTKMEDYAAVELNEAFAAQVLACDRELHFDRARLNSNGGAIALGHPIGCSGARIATTLVHELRRSGGRRGWQLCAYRAGWVWRWRSNWFKLRKGCSREWGKEHVQWTSAARSCRRDPRNSSLCDTAKRERSRG
jgi:acetyl-CoA acetyltransferase family protein